jgi:hypothetical protein
MNDAIMERLKVLETEYEAGQKMLAELDARRAAVLNTLLRIEGAIEVLKEMIGKLPAGNGASHGAATAGRGALPGLPG